MSIGPTFFFPFFLCFPLTWGWRFPLERDWGKKVSQGLLVLPSRWWVLNAWCFPNIEMSKLLPDWDYVAKWSCHGVGETAGAGDLAAVIDMSCWNSALCWALSSSLNHHSCSRICFVNASSLPETLSSTGAARLSLSAVVPIFHPLLMILDWLVGPLKNTDHNFITETLPFGVVRESTLDQGLRSWRTAGSVDWGAWNKTRNRELLSKVAQWSSPELIIVESQGQKM